MPGSLYWRRQLHRPRCRLVETQQYQISWWYLSYSGFLSGPWKGRRLSGCLPERSHHFQERPKPLLASRKASLMECFTYFEVFDIIADKAVPRGKERISTYGTWIKRLRIKPTIEEIASLPPEVKPPTPTSPARPPGMAQPRGSSVW